MRVELIGLLDVCLDSDNTQFLSQLGPIANMLSKAAADSNPEMKQKVATFAGRLCTELRDTAGNYMKATVVALTANLSHQHSKVRKVTLRGLKDVLVARGAEPFIADSLG